MFLASVKMDKVGLASAFLLLLTLLVPSQAQQLRFDKAKGEFKILQVADMHFADGKKTPCEDVLPPQFPSCSDLNTSSFLHRIILSENPHLIVFTGDNIYGFDATDAVTSMNAAFAPAVASNIPWAAVLGNHDQESTLSREGVMKYVVGMKHTLSRLNPTEFPTIDGFGNYNLQVHGVEGSNLANKSLLNFYFLDSGDYSTVPSIPGYGWIKPSQQLWFQRTSRKLRTAYMKKPEPQKSSAPGLAYFHIPLPEYASFDSSNFTGVKQEGISSPSVNSGFFTTMVEEGDVKAVFTGHDHLNDFCGELTGIHLCYAGGFGYHAYGKAGWARRARVVVASLEKTDKGDWGSVKSIKTWKRLDDAHLTPIDRQVLWSKNPSEIPLTNKQGHHIAIKMNSFEEWKLVFEMVAVNLALAVVNILLKKVLCEGMNHLLIIAYRQSISTIFLIPIAYFLERKSRPKLTARILCALFLSALLGATLSQYFFLMGLKHTSATFTCAFINMVPVNTFLIAILFRLEKVDMKNKSGRGKVLGALVCVGGVLILALYQGKALAIVPTKQSTARADLQTSQYGTKKKWAVGSVFLTAGSLVWSSWFLLQARIGKAYPCQYSSTAIMSFFSAIQSAILYLINNQNIHMSSWIVKGKLEIVTVIYAGTVGSGLCYVVMSWCVKQRGPVFTSAFSPLIQIFVALFEVLFLQEQIRLGSVVGSGLVIAGMYILLWGKSKEATEKASECDEVMPTRQ